MIRQKKYYEKNKRFQVYIPQTLYDFFVSYLQKYCQGETTPSQFRVFLYELQSLESRGITIANPLKDYETKRQQELRERFGDNLIQICVRGIITPNTSQRERENRCGLCKETRKQEYNACQEIQREIRTIKIEGTKNEIQKT